MMTAFIKGRTVADILAQKNKFITLVTADEVDDGLRQELGHFKIFEGVKKFPIRVKCATLAWHILKEALTDKSQTNTIPNERNQAMSQPELAISAETTPNPDTLKFNVGKNLLEKGSVDFTTAEAAEKSPLAKAMLATLPPSAKWRRTSKRNSERTTSSSLWARGISTKLQKL